MKLLFVPSVPFAHHQRGPWLGGCTRRSLTQHVPTNKFTAARMSAGNADASTENGEFVMLAEPPLPKEQFDPKLGSESGVVMSDSDSEEALNPSTAVSKSPARHELWLNSLISAFDTKPSDHPFAISASQANVKQSPPTNKVEEWRFTDLRLVYNASYVQPVVVDDVVVNAKRHIDDGACAVLVFVDGRYSATKSLFVDADVEALKAAGGYVGNMTGADRSIAAMFDRTELNGCVSRKGSSGLFAAINTAFASDAAVVDIPNDYVMSKHIVVLLATTGGASSDQTHPSAPRIAIRTAPGAKVHVVEAHVNANADSSSESHAFVMSSTAVTVGTDAEVKYCYAGQLSNQSQLISEVHADVSKRGRFVSTNVLIGGAVSRIGAVVELNGEESHGEIIGAAIADGRRVADLHSRFIHATKHTTSRQLQKNIATDRGRTVFSGRIVVPKGSDFTDAEQLCRSLLLSERAQVDAMPTLEIATDEVKATHGATISDLSAEELFYCQSRGISEALARSLLITGFVQEVLSDCPLKYLKESVEPIVVKIASEVKESANRIAEYASI